jgi:EAL domain-containing protein (putative c-di-GMP-specific phosphodiesterase class I)
MMEHADQATSTVRTLKAHGIQTCLDDFGTGYSSLSYLQRFPVSYLKIDRSFISRMEQDTNSLEIVKTIIQLAHQLGRKVIAEGLETVGQLQCLRDLGCEFGQGYYFAKPLNEQEAAAFLEQDSTW